MSSKTDSTSDKLRSQKETIICKAMEKQATQWKTYSGKEKGWTEAKPQRLEIITQDPISFKKNWSTTTHLLNVSVLHQIFLNEIEYPIYFLQRGMTYKKTVNFTRFEAGMILDFPIPRGIILTNNPESRKGFDLKQLDILHNSSDSQVNPFYSLWQQEVENKKSKIMKTIHESLERSKEIASESRIVTQIPSTHVLVYPCGNRTIISVQLVVQFRGTEERIIENGKSVNFRVSHCSNWTMTDAVDLLSKIARLAAMGKSSIPVQSKIPKNGNLDKFLALEDLRHQNMPDDDKLSWNELAGNNPSERIWDLIEMTRYPIDASAKCSKCGYENQLNFTLLALMWFKLRCKECKEILPKEVVVYVLKGYSDYEKKKLDAVGTLDRNAEIELTCDSCGTTASYSASTIHTFGSVRCQSCKSKITSK